MYVQEDNNNIQNDYKICNDSLWDRQSTRNIEAFGTR